MTKENQAVNNTIKYSIWETRTEEPQIESNEKSPEQIGKTDLKTRNNG